MNEKVSATPLNVRNSDRAKKQEIIYWNQYAVCTQSTDKPCVEV